MAKLIITLFILALVSAVTSDLCYSNTYRFGTYCPWGCCSNSFNPCCDRPNYARPVVVAPVGVGCAAAIGFIVGICRICCRRRAPATPSSAAPTRIVTTQQGANSNTRTTSPPPYTVQQITTQQGANSNTLTTSPPPYTVQQITTQQGANSNTPTAPPPPYTVQQIKY